jgi:hypothetical protein
MLLVLEIIGAPAGYRRGLMRGGVFFAFVTGSTPVRSGYRNINNNL